MHIQSTLVAFLVALSMASYYLLVEFDEPVEEQTSGEVLLKMAVEEIVSVEITGPEREPIKLTRTSGASQWQLEAPFKDQADQLAMHQIYRALHHTRILDSWRKPPADYGLAPPQLVVTLRDAKTRQTIKIGSRDPGGRRRYIQLDDDPRVCLIDDVLERAFAVEAEGLRDRRLLRMENPVARIKRLDFSVGPERWSILRRERVWRLDPGNERLSNETGAQISNLLNARFESTRPLVQTPVHAKILLRTAEGDPLELNISPLESERCYWVWGPGHDRMYQLSRMHLDMLLQGPDAIRSTSLVFGREGARNFSSIIVEEPARKRKVEVVMRNIQGNKVFDLARPGSLAHFSRKRANALARALEQYGIQKVLVAKPTAKQLGEYQLDPPIARWHLTKRWWDLDRHAETTTVLQIGALSNGVIAIRIDERPQIYAIGPILGKILRSGTLALRTSSLLALSAAELGGCRAIEFSSPGAKFSLTRKDRRWRDSQGKEITASAVDELLSQAAKVRVTFFLPEGTTAKQAGLDAPSVTMKLTLEDGSQRLLLIRSARKSGQPHQLGIEGGPFGETGPLDMIGETLAGDPPAMSVAELAGAIVKLLKSRR